MPQRIFLLWPVTALVSAAACLVFGIEYYPRGASDEVKYAHAAKRKAAYDKQGKGYEAHVSGRTEEAIARYREALDIDPTIGPAHFYLGTALVEIGKPDDAIEEFDRTIALEGAPAHAYNSRGALRSMKGDFAGAERDFRAALKIDPAFLTAHANLGLALLRDGKAKDAAAEFDTVIAGLANPGQGMEAYMGRGVARASSGDAKGAESDFTDAFDYGLRKDRILATLYNRARVRDAQGDTAGAQADRAEYARLKDLPEKSDRFVRPLKGVETKK